MSRLIVINPNTCQNPELAGHDCVFEELPNVSTKEGVSPKVIVTLNETTVSLTDHSADSS